MNGVNSTRFNTIAGNFILLIVLLCGINHAMVAQTPSCACKGAIQVSVDQACEAVITADMILANGSTCGGTSTAVVTLMKTPTGNIISSGTGQASLLEGQLYIGKTIYGKVSTANGSNSCWTTITVEDKQKPTWEDTDPLDLVVTCPAVGAFTPTAIDNCHTPRVYIVSEQIIVNDCTNPLFAGPDTLKLIERRYLARDESGNISDAQCIVRLWVVGLNLNDIVGVKNISIQCDDDYARLPNGNPSPVDIKIGNKTYFGTGVPALYPWMPVVRSAGSADVNPVNGNLRLSGGTLFGDLGGVGAQICIRVPAAGVISFNWNAQMKGTVPPVGDYAGDHAQYGVNGSWTNLTVGGAGSGALPQSGTNVNVVVAKDDEFCFRVRTNNISRWTELMISNITGPIPPSLALNPGGDQYCNIFVSYEDTKFPTIKCVTKIMRKWQILEWSCNSKIKEYFQIIEILDSKGPVVTGLQDDVASTNGYTCEGIYRLQKPKTITDNCSSNLTYDVTYPGGFIKGLKLTDGERFIPLPLGCNIVTYTAFDECHNQNEYSISVIVEDNTAPVAVCIQNTVVGLTLDGYAQVPATSFDNGSYDDCNLAKMLVRRMNPEPCKPCKRPEFPGFTYLGEFTQAANIQVESKGPHYYYISKHRSTPDVAIKTAAAMGGYVVAINSAAEDTWVYNRVKDWNLASDYLIGLRDIKRKGLFAWLSGETTTYRNWGFGNPKDILDGYNSYDYVRVLDQNGSWEDFGSYKCEEGEYLYVVEITDPCGFSAYTQFCCTDVSATPQVVVFRVIDKAGNWNECMVNATIQDKLPPSIICPPHMTVTCNDFFDTGKLIKSFGWPTAYDNCTSTRITTDSIIELNSCRIGRIIRNFTATDPGGRTAKCTQIIMVRGTDNPFVMSEYRWPKDTLIIGCENPNDAEFSPNNLGRPDLTADNICSLVGADYQDQVFYFNNTSGQSCFKILRHWTVIDWCQRYENDGGGFDYRTWSHTQVIKVHDPDKPVITSSCAPKTVCTYDPTCTEGYIELTASATDKCTKELNWYYKIDAFNDGSFESGLSKSGLGNSANASGKYPIGTHRIEWTFEDKCGNLTKCEQLFTIVNCKAPTPYCINGLATSLMPVDTNGDGTPDIGMVDIWAKDFDNNSSHPCPGYSVIHSFRPVTRANDGTPVIVRGRTYTCDSLGRRNVNVYIAVLDRNGRLVLDDQGRVVQDFCTTFITVQDNFKVCKNSGRVVVKGSLMTEGSAGVKEVNVSLEGSEKNMFTGNNGLYTFDEVLNGGNYVVKPGKNNDPMNGVSTLDLVIMQRHILGIDKIASPYKLIAADVNKDQKITAADLVELRKLILGIINDFQSNESWRFVDKTYKFQDAENAHTESFPEAYYIENINTNMDIDFMAVKIGDVNGNVVANANGTLTEARSSASLQLSADNQVFNAGQVISVPVKAKESSSVSGFQFTVDFDTELFSLEAVNGSLAGMTDANFGFTKLANGIVTVSYNREASIELNSGDKLFTLVLKAKDNGKLSEGLDINSMVTKAEAYSTDDHVMNVEFEVSNRVAESVVLYQNTPNPFKSVTMIGFELPETMYGTVTVYDVTGKSLKVIKNTFNKGYNSIELNKNELGGTGVLYYTLEAGDFKATKKMVVIE